MAKILAFLRKAALAISIVAVLVLGTAIVGGVYLYHEASKIVTIQPRIEEIPHKIGVVKKVVKKIKKVVHLEKKFEKKTPEKVEKKKTWAEENCPEVKSNVEKYGVDAVMQGAKQHGWTDLQVKLARKECKV